jgi:hypothetical protein
MNFLKRRRILKSTNTSDLIPIRVYGHDEIEGKVVILVPKFENKIIHTLFPRTQLLFYRIKLDDLGSSVWKNIRGEKNISGISHVVMDELGEKAQPVEELEARISKFMSLLYDRRYISFRQLLDN